MFDSGCGLTHPSIPSRLRAGALLRVGSSREGKQVFASCETPLNVTKSITCFRMKGCSDKDVSIVFFLKPVSAFTREST